MPSLEPSQSEKEFEFTPDANGEFSGTLDSTKESTSFKMGLRQPE